MRGPNHKQWAHDGLTVDLTQFSSKDKTAQADFKTTLKSAYDYFFLDGKMMGLPWDLSTITVAYSLDALERRGLKPPSELGAQWDWNAFIAPRHRGLEQTQQLAGLCIPVLGTRELAGALDR